MTRRMVCAAGAMLLAGLNGWTSPAHAQGPMAPRMDVAPPPARVAPPPPPVFVPPPVAPTPPPMPVAPVMAPAPRAPTASAPATPTPATPAPVATPTPTPAPPPATGSQAPRTTASAPPPYTDSQVKALRGAGVSLRGPGGQRQATTDSNGVVSLGKLGPGRHELSVNRKSLGTGGVNQPVIVGLLLPAVQAAREGARRYETVVVQPAKDPPPLQIKVDVDSRGQVTTIDWGTGIGVNVATGDVNGDGRADIRLLADLAKRNTSGETRLVLVAPVPGSNAVALADANNILQEVSTTRLGTSPGNPTGPEKPMPNYSNQPIRGIDVVKQKKPAGNAIKQTTGGDGTSTLGVLTPGTHSVVLDTKKLLDVRIPGSSGREPAQPAGILIGLLLPAVQKLGEVPQPTMVERAFPRSVLASKRELQIDIIIPDGGGSLKVNWGDGSPQTDVGRDGVPAPSGLRISADVSTIRVQGLAESNTMLQEVSTTRLGTSPGNPGAGDKPTANEAILNTTRSNIKRPSVMLPNVGVTATGSGGVIQARSDGGGWTRLGKLPVGNTVIEFSGADLASALKNAGGAAGSITTTGRSTRVNDTEDVKIGGTVLVIAVVAAVRTDGTVAVFTGSVPASAVKSLKADLRIGRDGNAMEANWGGGQQLPQILPRSGAASLSVPGPNGPIPLDPALVKALQDRAAGSAPGLVDANNILMDVSTTR